MATWTFVVEYEGGTYSSQIEADSLRTAIHRYNERDPSGIGAVPLDPEAVALEGLKGVFCASGLAKTGERLVLANIVRTDASA